MADITLRFEPRPDKGSSYDNYDMFVDINHATTIKHEVPEGWDIAGIKFYKLEDSGKGHSRPDAMLKDLEALRKGSIQTTFSNANAARADQYEYFTLPRGWGFDKTTGILTDPGAIGGSWDYIIWIQVPTAPDKNFPHNGYDFIDPGIRNHRR